MAVPKKKRSQRVVRARRRIKRKNLQVQFFGDTLPVKNVLQFTDDVRMNVDGVPVCPGFKDNCANIPGSYCNKLCNFCHKTDDIRDPSSWEDWSSDDDFDYDDELDYDNESDYEDDELDYDNESNYDDDEWDSDDEWESDDESKKKK